MRIRMDEALFQKKKKFKTQNEKKIKESYENRIL